MLTLNVIGKCSCYLCWHKWINIAWFAVSFDIFQTEHYLWNDKLQKSLNVISISLSLIIHVFILRKSSQVFFEEMPRNYLNIQALVDPRAWMSYFDGSCFIKLIISVFSCYGLNKDSISGQANLVQILY